MSNQINHEPAADQRVRYENQQGIGSPEVDVTTGEPLDAVLETKAEAFKRVANYRLEKTTMRLRQFHALANTGNYEYTDEQVEVILTALDAEVQAIEDAFKVKDKAAGIVQL